MQKRKRILFISNDAKVYGSSRSLAELLRVFAGTQPWSMRVVVLRGGGPLMATFRRYAPVRNYARPGEPLRMWWRAAIRQHGLRRGVARWLAARLAEWGRRRTVAWGRRWQPDLIYANTVMNRDLIRAVRDPSTPLVVHARELNTFLGKLPPADVASLREETTLILAASEAVKRNLVDNHGLAPGAIEIVSPSINAADVEHRGRSSARTRVRNRLGLDKTTVLVGAAGTARDFKGTDLFLDTARLAAERCGDCDLRFIWVGMGPDLEQMRAGAQQAGLADRFYLPGLQDDPYPFISAMDILFMCSREDSFPRVNLEAAVLGKPIVTFTGSGGSEEFVGQNCGRLVPGFDTAAAADAIIDLALDAGARERYGRQGRENVLRGYTSEIVGGRAAAHVNRVLAAKQN